MIEGIRQLAMVNDPPPHFIIGLSNVSTKCLLNKLLNRTFLVMCLTAGLDAAIVDAADQDLIDAMITAEVLLGKTPLQRRIRQGLENAKRIAGRLLDTVGLLSCEALST